MHLNISIIHWPDMIHKKPRYARQKYVVRFTAYSSADERIGFYVHISYLHICIVIVVVI